jgi:hypothetical protein
MVELDYRMIRKGYPLRGYLKQKMLREIIGAGLLHDP